MLKYPWKVVINMKIQNQTSDPLNIDKCNQEHTLPHDVENDFDNDGNGQIIQNEDDKCKECKY